MFVEGDGSSRPRKSPSIILVSSPALEEPYRLLILVPVAIIGVSPQSFALHDTLPEGVEEMITLFHVTGAYIYVDPDGNAVGVEDVFTKLEAARKRYGAVGLGTDYVDRFVR